MGVPESPEPKRDYPDDARSQHARLTLRPVSRAEPSIRGGIYASAILYVDEAKFTEEASLLINLIK
jgi:hypothetical protein